VGFLEKKIGVVVVGYGFMGTTHLESWSLIPEARILGVVGRHKAKAQHIAKKYKVKVYPSLESAIKKREVDVVDICTPTFTHCPLVVQAAEAGKHVFVEKPIALTLRDADAMIKAAERSRVKFMVAHCLRFFPEYMKVKEIVSQGTIGEPVMARAHRSGPLPRWGRDNWFSDKSKSGGVAVDLAIHDVDFLRWCFSDEVRRVYASVNRLVRKGGTSSDHALIILRFKQDAIAHVEASWAVPDQAPFTTYFELAGTKGWLSVDNSSVVPVTVMSNGRVDRFSPDTMPWITGMPFPIDPYYRETRHFIDCIIKDEQPVTGGREARSSLEVCLAALQSANTQGPVDLPLGVK